MKHCNKCNKDKDEKEFGISSIYIDGLAKYCKECVREYSKRAYEIKKQKEIDETKKRKNRWGGLIHTKEIYTEEELNKRKLIGKKRRLKAKYNLTLDEYNDLCRKQNNSCAICGTSFEKEQYNCVDHSHETGVIRGLLCLRCNWLLGHVKDQIVIFEKAIEYLKYWEKIA
jgi:hypothetical protein